jgi:hypothetical protein
LIRIQIYVLEEFGMKSKKFLWIAAAFLVAGIISACAEEEGGLEELVVGEVVTLSISQSDTVVTPGGTVRFTPTVKVGGKTVPLPFIKWTLSGFTDSGTMLTPTAAEEPISESTEEPISESPAGLAQAIGENAADEPADGQTPNPIELTTDTPVTLTVAEGETATKLSVKAAATVSGKTVSKTVEIPINGGGLTIQPGTAVSRGGKRQFTAYYDRDALTSGVTWIVSGQNGETAITVSGYLSVDADETAKTLTVKASYNSEYEANIIIQVTDPASGNPPSNNGGKSLKETFGIPDTDDKVQDVTNTFSAVHNFIQNGGLSPEQTTIQLGDWIDLEDGITVADYNEEGAFSYTAEKAVEPVTWTVTNATGQFSMFSPRDKEPRGTWCRLIVVGINSFNAVNGNNTPHVVFQFQNIPVYRRMNPTDTNAGGYRDSEMRRYLTDVAEDGNNGKFLEGLKNAGVPVETALWAPKRIVSVKNGQGVIEDLLWLPTERELFGSGTWSVSADETEGNQARLEYYTDKDSLAKFCAKFWTNATIIADYFDWWRAASPSGRYGSTFCGLASGGEPIDYTYANYAGGCVPAFCVR